MAGSGSVRTVQWINTSHPSDTTSTHSLSLIRAHVARRSRALQKEERQQKQAQTLAASRGVITNGRLLTVKGADKGSAAGEDDEEGADGRGGPADGVIGKFRVTGAGTTGAGLRRIAAKPRRRQGSSPSLTTRSLATAADLNPSPTQPAGEHCVLSPRQLIGGGRRNAYEGYFARPLEDDEPFLFDYFTEFVIAYGYKKCRHKCDDLVFRHNMRTVWLPFLMSHPGLMAAVFHVACRNYSSAVSSGTGTGDGGEKGACSAATRFKVRKLQYRLTCLEAARKAIAGEEIASDATIALALIMASESFFEGEIDAFRAHGSAIIKMVTARGGLETLGVSGFLASIVGWSIYDPAQRLVGGPAEDPSRSEW